MQQNNPVPSDSSAIRSATPSLASDAHEQPAPAEPEVGRPAPPAQELDIALLVADQRAREPAVRRSRSAVVLILEARRLLELACSLSVSSPGFVEQITEIRQLIREACDLSREVALATGLLQPDGRYSIRHSVDVAVACEVVGSTIEMRESELTSMVCAALTMNISMLTLQDTLHSQQEPLTKAQREIIQDHPAQSEALLRTLGVGDELWLKAVSCHHDGAERSGGSVSRSTGGETPVAAELIALADIYYARTSSRANRPALGPSTVLKTLFLGEGDAVRRGSTPQFIKALGIFPPGTAVSLHNGEIAVVTGPGKKPNAPGVCAITDCDGMPLLTPVVRDTRIHPFTVRKVLEWSTVGNPPNMRSLWGHVAAQT